MRYNNPYTKKGLSKVAYYDGRYDHLTPQQLIARARAEIKASTPEFRAPIPAWVPPMPANYQPAPIPVQPAPAPTAVAPVATDQTMQQTTPVVAPNPVANGNSTWWVPWATIPTTALATGFITKKLMGNPTANMTDEDRKAFLRRRRRATFAAEMAGLFLGIPLSNRIQNAINKAKDIKNAKQP